MAGILDRLQQRGPDDGLKVAERNSDEVRRAFEFLGDTDPLVHAIRLDGGFSVRTDDGGDDGA